MVANWQTLLQASFSGRLPSGKEIETMTRRNASIAEHLSQAGSKALAPVHRAATANAKRLKR